MASSQTADPFSEDNDFLMRINLTQLTTENHRDNTQTPSPTYSPLASQNSTDMPISDMDSQLHNVMEVLEEVDNEASLSIWELLSTIKEDKLVEEYCELITKVKTKPAVPDASLLESLPVPNFDLSVPTQVKVLNLLTSYFQCRY